MKTEIETEVIFYEHVKKPNGTEIIINVVRIEINTQLIIILIYVT